MAEVELTKYVCDVSCANSESIYSTYPSAQGYTIGKNNKHIALKIHNDGEKGCILEFLNSGGIYQEARTDCHFGHGNDCTYYDGYYYVAEGGGEDEESETQYTIRRYDSEYKKDKYYECIGANESTTEDEKIKATGITHLTGDFFLVFGSVWKSDDGSGKIFVCKKYDNPTDSKPGRFAVMRKIFLELCCLLFICILSFGRSSDTCQAANAEEMPMYLYQKETGTLLLRKKGADVTAELAKGYAILPAGFPQGEPAEQLIIGNDVTAISRNILDAIHVSIISFESVTIGDGITVLPDELFYPDAQEMHFGCWGSLETISLGKSVQSIGDYAFYRCKSLENIIVNPDNPYLKIEQNGLYSKDGKILYAYPVAADVDPVIAPGTQKISPAVFAFSHMTGIDIPASVEALSKELFKDCKALEKLTFAENSNCVQTEGFCFSGCTSLREVRFGEKFQNLAASTFTDSGLCSVYFGKAFQGIVHSEGSNKEFYFLAGDRENENQLFPCLEKIQVSKQNKYFKVRNAALLSKNGKKLYYYPTARKNKSYTVPASVKTIAKGAFYANPYLQKVRTGKNTETIGKFAFSYCKKMTKISLGKNVKTLKAEVFLSCVKLTTIINLEKIKKIGKFAFAATKIIYVPDWSTHEYPETYLGKVMYFYTKAGNKKTTWRITKGAECVKIQKRYKNSNRIKVKFKKKGSVVIQAKQGKKKTNYDFQIR